MESKQIRNLALVFAALVVLVLVVERPWSGGSRDEAPSLYPDFEAGRIDRIHVTDKGETVNLIRQDARWIIDGAYPLPADTSAINRALASVGEFTTDQIASENTEKFAVYEVDSAGAEVKLFAGGDEPTVDLILGKSTPEMGTYFRPSDANKVYASPDRVRSLFARPARSWQDRKVFDVEQAEISRLVVERGDSTIVFEKGADDAWALKEPLDFPVKQTEMDQLLRGICKLVANAFPDTAVSAEEAGFEDPMLKVSAERVDGSGIELIVGKQGEDGMYLARAADRDWVYKLAKYRIDPYYKDLATLEAEPPPEPPAAEPAPEPSGPESG